MIVLILYTVFVVLPILYIVASLIYQNVSHRFNIVKNIPGPKVYPIIGRLHDMFLSAEQMWARDRKYALQYPLYKYTILNEVIVNIANPEDTEIILSSMKYNTKGQLYDLLHPWLGTGLLTSEGSKWHKRRKILTPAFHFSILQNFVDIFNVETTRLVETLQNRCATEPDINVVPLITDFTLRSIVETSMGKKFDMSKESQNYKQAVYDFGQLFLYRALRPWLYYPSINALTKTGKILQEICKTLHNFSEKVIDDKKRNFESYSYSGNKKLAMLDLLLKAQSNGEAIDDEGIREEVDTFIFEGHDTTSIAICFILLVLANHKEYQDEIYQEIIEVLGDGDELPTFKQLQDLPYMERCLKECLRLYPSVPSIARAINEDVQLTNGYKIPAYGILNLHIYDMHHNPKYFPDPEKFDPDRFLPENIKDRHPYSYIPFSAGPRNCIGQRYAMLELKAAVCGILKKFKLEAITKRSDIVFFTDIVLRTNNEIRMKFVPRQ